MEENGKKWKKSVVDVQIEGVLVRSCLDGWNDFVLIVGIIYVLIFVLIVGMIIQDIVQDITYDHSNI